MGQPTGRQNQDNALKRQSCQVDLSFGFDDEKGVGVCATRCAEFCAGIFERIRQHREDDAAVMATYEMEAEFLLDELK